MNNTFYGLFRLYVHLGNFALEQRKNIVSAKWKVMGTKLTVYNLAASPFGHVIGDYLFKCCSETAVATTLLDIRKTISTLSRMVKPHLIYELSCYQPTKSQRERGTFPARRR